MNLKITLVALLVSGSAFAQKAVVEAGKSAAGKNTVIEATRGNKKATETVLKQSQQAVGTQVKAGQVEADAKAALNKTEAQAYGDKIVATAEKELGTCTSALCNAYKGNGQIAQLAKEGDSVASNTIRDAVIKARTNKGQNLDNVVRQSLIDSGKDVKQVEEACGSN